MPQREARADQHHRDEERRPCDFRLQEDPVACGRKPGLFKLRDEPRQGPDRDRARRRETVLDLLARQVRGQPQLHQPLGRAQRVVLAQGQAPALHPAQHPFIRRQHGRGGFHPRDQLVARVELMQPHAKQLGPIGRGTPRLDHGLPALQPCRSHRLPPANDSTLAFCPVIRAFSRSARSAEAQRSGCRPWSPPAPSAPRPSAATPAPARRTPRQRGRSPSRTYAPDPER